MSRRGSWLAVCIALGASVACQSEVTVYLLQTGLGGQGGANEAGATEPPCQKIGPEVCNGADDDCNGVVDEGCAYGIDWTSGVDSAALGHATGGVMFLAPCARGSALTGLRLGMGKWLNQVVAVCRQVELDADSSKDPVAFSVALGARLDSSFVPASTQDPTNKVQDLLCPDGSVVSGVDAAVDSGDAHYIRTIRLSCSPLIVTSTSTSAVLDCDHDKETTVGPSVCSECPATQPYSDTMSIPPGHVAAGIFGGDGLWVDRLGFSSALGTITMK